MNDVVLVAIIAAVPATLSAVLGLMNRAKIEKTQTQIATAQTQIASVDVKVDGALAELLSEVRKSSHAEGMKEQKDHPPKI